MDVEFTHVWKDYSELGTRDEVRKQKLRSCPKTFQGSQW